MMSLGGRYISRSHPLGRYTVSPRDSPSPTPTLCATGGWAAGLEGKDGAAEEEAAVEAGSVAGSGEGEERSRTGGRKGEAPATARLCGV